MALTVASMTDKIMNYIDAVAAPDQGNPYNLYFYRRQIIAAICTGIIEEIHENIEITACQQYPEIRVGTEVVDAPESTP